MSERKRVLAISTTAIGDTLLGVPAMISLGLEYDLDVLVHQRQRSLLVGNPYLKLLYPYRNNFFYRLGLAWHLRATRYHRVVILHANHDILKLLPRLKYQRAGNIQGWNDPKLRLEAVAPDPKLHAIDKRLRIAFWAGAVPATLDMRIFLSPQEIEAGESWLVAKGLERDRPRVGLCPGAAQPYKRWPAERFGELAALLKKAGVGVYVLGAAGEKDLYRRLCGAAGFQPPAALGLELRLSAALLSMSDLLVTNDTGPMHMALAVGLPVLALFGPTDHQTIGPRNPESRVLAVPPTCQPCLTKKCPHGECMQALQVERVARAAGEMLGQGPARPGERHE